MNQHRSEYRGREMDPYENNLCERRDTWSGTSHCSDRRNNGNYYAISSSSWSASGGGPINNSTRHNSSRTPRTNQFDFRDKRKAAYILDSALNAEYITPQQNDQIRWAQMVLPNYETSRAGAGKANHKTKKKGSNPYSYHHTPKDDRHHFPDEDHCIDEHHWQDKQHYQDEHHWQNNPLNQDEDTSQDNDHWQEKHHYQEEHTSQENFHWQDKHNYQEEYTSQDKYHWQDELHSQEEHHSQGEHYSEYEFQSQDDHQSQDEHDSFKTEPDPAPTANGSGKLVIGVLDRAAIGGFVSRENWKTVEGELQDSFLGHLERMGGPPPVCRDGGWHQGRIKLIVCQDARSAYMYKEAVAALGEVYEGAKLEAVDLDQIPFVPRAHIWVSAKPAEPERILKLLQVCNPQMPTADWRVTRVFEPEGNSRQISVTLNEKTLDALEKVNGLLQYGCRQVSVRIYKSDTKNKKGAVEPELEAVVVGPQKHKKIYQKS